jgi:DNA-binding transcriptional ArsR family regulator
MGALNPEKIETLKRLRERSVPNKEICKRLEISSPTLAKWIKRLGLPNRYEEERERNLKEIHSAIERLGCCTIKEVSEETELRISTVQKHMSSLTRQGKLKKIDIKREDKGKVVYKLAELFGESAGLVLFYRARKEVICRLLRTITTSTDDGTKRALTRYLNSFGFSQEEIEWISKARLARQNKVNIQFKSEDVERLQNLRPEGSVDQFLTMLTEDPTSFSFTLVGGS